MKTKIKAAMRKNVPGIKAFLLKKYPSFIYRKDDLSDSAYIPVFVSHEVDTDSLEKKLLYLKKNGYQTLDSSEWMDSVQHAENNQQRKVVLTFDDGHISLWKNAFPLLKKYKFKAVSFICPGLVPGEKYYEFSEKNRKLCNWNELRIMHDSGYVDFQSHTLNHDLVCCSSRFMDLFHPTFESHYFGKNDKAVAISNGNYITVTNLWPYGNAEQNEFWGMPIFELKPRLAADKRFEVSEKVCAYFRGLGKTAWGNVNNRKNKRKRLVKKEILRFSEKELGKYIAGSEYQNEIAKNLIDAKAIIEEKLPSKKVRHLCAPWFEANENTLKTAADSGFASVFLGDNAFPWRSNPAHETTIYNIPRLSEHYIFRLPSNK